jgi:hypothetical protein
VGFHAWLERNVFVPREGSLRYRNRFCGFKSPPVTQDQGQGMAFGSERLPERCRKTLKLPDAKRKAVVPRPFGPCRRSLAGQ